MKTIILYNTKYGSVEKCVQMLQENLMGEVQICNVNKETKIQLEDYDLVILGGSIYVGHIQKVMKSFMLNHLSILKTKRLGLFICCMRSNELALNELETAFPKELSDIAVVKDYFGGEIIYHKMKFIDRLLTKMVTKADKDFPKLDENKNISLIREDAIKNFSMRISGE